jgi:hypothetical protein
MNLLGRKEGSPAARVDGAAPFVVCLGKGED